jgi:hypothetical protein
MAAAELAFERFSGALEATHGTAVTPPTFAFNLDGTLTPDHSRSRRSRKDGTLAEFYSSVITRAGAGWTAEGDLDINTVCFFLEMAIKGAGVIATPGGGTLSRTHTYTPTMTSDDLLSATLFWGDPGTQILRSVYAMVDTLTITNDASSEDGAMMSFDGRAKFPTEVSAPTQPSFITSGLIVGQNMQLWMDTSSAIGTTAVTGRVISVEHTLSTGLSYKFLAGGTAADLSFNRHGRGKRHLETKMVFELADMTQYDLFAAGTSTKTRVRHNGSTAIETTLFPYLQVDTYGPLEDLNWGDLEGTNRTVEFTIQSEYDATLGADFSFQVQNARTTI